MHMEQDGNAIHPVPCGQYAQDDLPLCKQGQCELPAPILDNGEHGRRDT